MAYSWHDFHLLLPPYYLLGVLLSFKNPFMKNFYGLMLSPSRGLLVCVPITSFIFYLVVRYRRTLPARPLAILAASILALQILMLSPLPFWVVSEGGCFGARYFTDAVPWIILLAILGVSAWLCQREIPGRTEAAAGLFLLACSAFINGRGATSLESWKWNDGLPATVTARNAWAWMMDWRNPQWLAGLLPPPLPREFPPLAAGEKLELAQSGSDRYLRLLYGWSVAERDFRRTDGRAAYIAFRMAPPPSPVLELNLDTFLIPSELRRQRLRVSINRKPVAALTIDDPAVRTYRLRIPDGVLRENNVLRLETPDARSPKSLGQSDDVRPLAIALHWMRIGSESRDAQVHCLVCYSELPPAVPPLSPAGFACRIELSAPPFPAAVGGAARTIGVKLTNQSAQTWPGWPDPAEERSLRNSVNLGYHWLDAGGKAVIEGRHLPLPAPLAPGQSVEMEMAVAPMPAAGRYTLKVEPLQEGVAWFSSVGGCSATLEAAFTP